MKPSARKIPIPNLFYIERKSPWTSKKKSKNSSRRSPETNSSEGSSQRIPLRPSNRIDLPDDQVEKIADGVKAKLTVDKVSGLADGLKGLFGGKKE